MILKVITPIAKYITHNLGSILFYGVLAYITVSPNDLATMQNRSEQLIGFISSAGAVIGGVLNDLLRGGA